MEIAFVGFGNVGLPLADHLQRLGHAVTLAARDPAAGSVRAALARNPGLRVAAVETAVRDAGTVFLATPYAVNAQVLPPLAPLLTGKVLVDCTNPVGPGLTHGLGSRESGAQVVQRLAPAARVVKAFTVYGFENLEDNRFPAANVRPAMFLCGDDADARRQVGGLADQMGWQPLDVGGLDQALHLEHMTLLWIRHVRVNGHSPHLTWAALSR